MVSFKSKTFDQDNFIKNSMNKIHPVFDESCFSIFYSATFDCSWLGDRSFCIDPDHIKLPGYGQDESGSVGYLAGTLSLLRSYNKDRLAS